MKTCTDSNDKGRVKGIKKTKYYYMATICIKFSYALIAAALRAETQLYELLK